MAMGAVEAPSWDNLPYDDLLESPSDDLVSAVSDLQVSATPDALSSSEYTKIEMRW